MNNDEERAEKNYINMYTKESEVTFRLAHIILILCIFFT